MPGIMIERPKMTTIMYQSLKRHIMKEREKIKQEQEQDEELERLRKEREQKKKKEEEDSLTLEQTKEQITQVDKKLEGLRGEKHDLFSQLKKVLHQEDESRKKAQLKEHNEMLQHMQSQGQQYHGGVAVPGHPNLYLQGGHLTPQPTKYMSVPMQRPVHGGVKRARSPARSPSPPRPVAQPTPPQSSVYPHYPSKYTPPTATAGSAAPYQPPTAPTAKQDYPTPKTVNYVPATNNVTYASQSQHSYQHTQTQQATTYSGTSQSTSSKYPATSSAFVNYPPHFQAAGQTAGQQPPAVSVQSSVQKPADHYSQSQAGPGSGQYTVQQQQQRMPTPTGYLKTGNSSLPLQQQLEQANHKSGFSKDIPAPALRGLAPSLHAVQGQQTAQPGSIVTGYPIRTQPTAPTSTAYQAPPHTATSQNVAVATSTASRHAYSAQAPPRTYY